MAAGSLLPSGYETLEDANGVTIPGGLIWTYAAGTTTPLATYTDSTLVVPNTNPIIADGAGRWLAYAAPGTGFKFVFETPAIPPAHGATIKTCDNIAAPLTDSTSGATGGVTVISDNTTGTANNFVLPGRTKDTLWVWNGSANLSITGLSGGAQGDRITIKNMSTVAGRQILFAHMSASSSQPFYNFIAIATATPVGVNGSATFTLVGGTWVMTDHTQGEWAIYTPTWGDLSVNPTLGNGTLTGRYQFAGKSCLYTIQLILGSTTVVTGSTGWVFTTPINAQGSQSAGVVSFQNAGGGVLTSGSTFHFGPNQFYMISGAGAAVGATVPLAWAANCQLFVRGSFEVA